MAKKKAQGATYLNPPFDSRLLGVGYWGYRGKGKFKRGRIVQALAPRQGVRFLYNPLEITANHSLSIDLMSSQGTSLDALKGLDGLQTGFLMNLGDVSVSLLYDRTYEMWDRSKAHTAAGKYGVYADVLAFYQMLNITKAHSSVKQTLHDLETGNFGTTEVWNSFYPKNQLTPTLVNLFIGDTLRYYGMVQGLSITYSHFTHRMVPTRCAVDLSIQFMPDPNDSGKTTKKKKTPTPGPFKGGLGKP